MQESGIATRFAKINFFNPKDTTLTDSLHVTFRFKVDNNGHANTGLLWNFSDGKNETTNTTIGAHVHLFPSLGNYTFSVSLIDSNSKSVFDTLSGSVHINFSSAKIRFFSPKDTMLIDSLGVMFHLAVDTIQQTRNKLYWNFSDGSSYTTSININSYQHIFPGPGNYAFSVNLMDVTSMNKLDSVSGTIQITKTPPTLAELQQMKFFKIQVYCPVNYCYDTSKEITSPYFFVIDPLIKNDQNLVPRPYDYLPIDQSQLKWQGYSFSLSYNNSWHDSSYSTLGHYSVVDIGGINWQFHGSINQNNNSIDSAVLLNSLVDNSYDSHGAHNEGLYLSANLISLPFFTRDNDSLIYEVKSSVLGKVLKKISRAESSSGWGHDINDGYCGPYLESTNIASSYARIIFYK